MSDHPAEPVSSTPAEPRSLGIIVVDSGQTLEARLSAAFKLGLRRGKAEGIAEERERLRAVRLNGPMVASLRRCAADTSPNWDGAITVYPPGARDLVALIDALNETGGGSDA